MKAVIFFSGLAGLLIFGPPAWKAHRQHGVSVVVHEVSHIRVSSNGQDDCRFEAERRVSSPAGSVDMLRLDAGSGSLTVTGVDGLGEIRAVARACASNETFLDDLQITSTMEGSSLVVETHYPDLSGRTGGNRYARLDLTVEVPMGLAAEIQDGSGEASFAGLGPLTLQDGSGGVSVMGIMGDLTIHDGSGELKIRDVSGVVRVEDGSGGITVENSGSDVEIRDSSGEMEIRGVEGSVTLQDGSGGIDVSDVTGSVRVVVDSSGEIDVRGITGDFIVEKDGSGSIRHEAVQGTVTIPRKGRGM